MTDELKEGQGAVETVAVCPVNDQGDVVVGETNSNIAEQVAKAEPSIEIYDDSKKVYDIAGRAYECRRAIAIHVLDVHREPWTHLTPEEQRSTIESVIDTLKDPSQSPSQSHNKWMARKAKQGWSYGPDRNEACQRSPFMLPWSELDDNCRLLSFVFHTAILARIPKTV
jgi:hypothetical protein